MTFLDDGYLMRQRADFRHVMHARYSLMRHWHTRPSLRTHAFDFTALIHVRARTTEKIT